MFGYVILGPHAYALVNLHPTRFRPKLMSCSSQPSFTNAKTSLKLMAWQRAIAIFMESKRLKKIGNWQLTKFDNCTAQRNAFYSYRNLTPAPFSLLSKQSIFCLP